MLLDIQMPEMDGYELARRIRQNPRWQALPIIAITANAVTDERERCLAAGMRDYLTKPVQINALYATLARWLPARAGATALDLQASARGIGGSLPLYRSLLQDFRRDHGDTLILLQRAAAARDFLAVGELAHTIKGLAGIFSADALAGAAQALQTAAADGNQRDVEAELERFAAAFAAVIQAADAELGAEAPA